MDRVGDTDMLERLTALLRERIDVPAEELRRDASLEELGLDSVELAFIFSHFERDTGLNFDDAEVDVSRYGTLGSVADVLAAKVASAADG